MMIKRYSLWSLLKSSTDCPVDSNVNEVTWNAIYDVYTGIIDSLPDSAFVGTVRPYPGVPLRQGATGPYVEDLQEYLNVIASVYTNIPTVTVDGVYGAGTRAAVEAFQSTFGLPVTGIADLRTWQVIGEQYSNIEGGRMRSTGQFLDTRWALHDQDRRLQRFCV